MSDADAMITALRSGYDSLAGLVSGLSDDDLAGPSGASEWDISQVLSHLGSGAEISAATLQAALDGKPGPGRDFNQSVWDRWDAMSPRARVGGFGDANAALTELFESLPASVRAELRITLAFLPAPVDVATAARFRLSELTLHSWDVRAGFDPAATLAADATDLIAAGMGMLAGLIAKTEPLAGRAGVIEVATSSPALRLALRLGEQVSVDTDVPADPSGTLTLPAEAWVRLITGRLKPQYTPAEVTATGAADLDVLRQVFPGF